MSAHNSEGTSEAPPGVHTPQAAFPVSESSSLDLSTSSKLESMTEVQATEDGEDEALMTSENSPSLVSSADHTEDNTEETGTSTEVSPEEDKPPTMSSPRLATEETAPGPEAPPLDSIKEIRDLVVEVMEVEELVQRYPSGPPAEE